MANLRIPSCTPLEDYTQDTSMPFVVKEAYVIDGTDIMVATTLELMDQGEHAESVPFMIPSGKKHLFMTGRPVHFYELDGEIRARWP